MGVFKFGLAGAGRMGRNHLRALSDSEVVDVAAIAEPAEHTRSALRSSGARVFENLEAMIDAGGLDAVLVCVPSDLHLESVRRLVAAGLPILCEKPLGVTPAQAREAALLVSSTGVPLQIGFWRRFVPMLKRLRERISSGELGGVYAIECYQWDGQPPNAVFRAHSGGIFVDMGVHEFDQTRWLTGQEFASITAHSSGIAEEPWPGDPECAQAIGRLSAGTSVFVSLGRRFHLGDVCKVEVFGTKDAEECRFLWPPSADETFFAALRLQAESFARHVGGAEREGAGAQDAAAAIEAAARAAASMAQAGVTVG